MLKGIIFDFDGVIVQSVQIKTEAFSEIYHQYDPSIVSKVVKHHESNGGISRYEKFRIYHNSFLNKPITDKEINQLSKKFSKLVMQKVINAPYVPGVLEYIKKSFRKYKLFISTGTPTKEINNILAERKISNYFAEIFGSPDKKQIHISRIISKYSFVSEELIFYGDSNSDVEAANDFNIPFILLENKENQILSNEFNGNKIKDFMEIL